MIGAGIAGTTAAYRLQQAGFETTLFESRDRVGGRIWTVRKGEFLMDLGTAVYLGTYRDAIALIKEVGLEPEFVVRSAMGAIPRDGVNHYLDYTTPIRTALGTRLLSPGAKLRGLRLAADVFAHRRGLGYDSYDQLAEIDTETVREYCRRRLNEELLQWCGRPLVSGTWVADDADTSVALMHWTVRNMLVPNVYNLISGVVGLPAKLAEYVDLRLGHAVRNVTDNGSSVEITYDAGGERTERFDTGVIATTARPALEIYPQVDEVTRGLYSSTRYRRLGSICLGLSRRPPDPATYFLVPPAEDPDTIAVIADHNKAPGRAPEGKGLLTVLLSHEYLERTEHLTDEQVLDYALDRAARYHGYDVAADLEEHAVVRWPESVPTLDRGRFARIADYRRRIDRSARVQFAGDLDRIPGLNGALVSGQEAATRVLDRFAARRVASPS
ncbi:protoporphyrinogen oxidase [Pseudonocardia eucalypti]|uniref:Protoporphyrinogen oxidase n=1 Tax=Pseudonocardia eucalypti TaxID=648755 RepID=A0ABP9R3U1_9PSEU